MAAVRSKTTKPVVTLGRFTSPDTMVSQIRRGITDFIGAARPSIADPFIPQKIEQGRTDDIRECIGCNICCSGDQKHYPIRCTQNPTMGEGWRRGWHPEKIAPKGSDDVVLVVGAGRAELQDAEVEALAFVLKTTLNACENLFGIALTYSMGMHPRLSDGLDHPEWQFHLHIYPPLLRSASVRKHLVGFEMLAMPQRDLTPEAAAEALRNALQEKPLS